MPFPRKLRYRTSFSFDLERPERRTALASPPRVWLISLRVNPADDDVSSLDPPAPSSATPQVVGSADAPEGEPSPVR